MALAVNRTGVILKKCDMSNHRPDSVKRCAATTCQHTCPANTIDKCPHAWTLRYWVNGKQLEKYQYRSVYLRHVHPVFGDMTLSQVANDRDGVTELLAVTMKHVNNAPRQHVRHVIVRTVERR